LTHRFLFSGCNVAIKITRMQATYIDTELQGKISHMLKQTTCPPRPYRCNLEMNGRWALKNEW